MADSDWRFAYVLPNLVLPDNPRENTPGEWPGGITLGSDYVAIVPGTDERVGSICGHYPGVERILDSFRDEVNQLYRPAVLIVRSSAPDSIQTNANATVDFRNAVALTLILSGRAALARGAGNPEPTWSDSFDFHPAGVNSRGYITIESPALRTLILNSPNLLFSPSPYISRVGSRLIPDRYLLRCLGKEWERRYVKPAHDESYSRTLFRSLDSAFQACAIGSKNQGSIHDYGIQVATWVSAIEILAWPQREHANLEIVLELLKEAPTHERLREQRFRIKVRKQVQRLTAIQRAYTYLYAARNQFLHGNPVSLSTLLTRNRRRVGLPQLAAIVYRAALAAYLVPKYDRPTTTWSDLAKYAGEVLDNGGYDSALAKLFGIKL